MSPRGICCPCRWPLSEPDSYRQGLGLRLEGPKWPRVYACPSRHLPYRVSPFATLPLEALGLFFLPGVPRFWKLLHPFLYPSMSRFFCHDLHPGLSALTARPIAAQSWGRSMLTGAVWERDVPSPEGRWWTKEMAGVPVCSRT